MRRKPLTIREYESDFRQQASDLQLVERVFVGGMDSNQLRAILWPYIFGLVKERGRFIRKTVSLSSVTNDHGHTNGSLPHNGHPPQNGHSIRHSTTITINGKAQKANGLANGNSTTTGRRQQRQRHRALGKPDQTASKVEQYVYIEHEDNLKRWRELERLYCSFESQWKSIMPEQELRFSVFRERKALIERDVVRSDRSHPFYSENSTTNLKSLTTLLMTYMMYDFDIGYLQGMSDIAAPILYVYQGDLVKSFWVFVEVMKLFRRNFEYSQKTIHFQLNCLFRLIKLTDPKLALHLRENDCSNCFFVFRCIVCKFKRELMKSQKMGSEQGGDSVSDLSDDDDREPRHHRNRSRTEATLTNGDGHSLSSNGPSDDEDEEEPEQEAELELEVEDNYERVLNLWDTIWSVQRRHELQAKSKCTHTFTIASNGDRSHKRPTQHQARSTPININGHHHHHHSPSPLSTHNSNGLASKCQKQTNISNNNNSNHHHHSHDNNHHQHRRCHKHLHAHHHHHNSQHRRHSHQRSLSPCSPGHLLSKSHHQTGPNSNRNHNVQRPQEIQKYKLAQSQIPRSPHALANTAARLKGRHSPVLRTTTMAATTTTTPNGPTCDLNRKQQQQRRHSSSSSQNLRSLLKRPSVSSICSQSSACSCVSELSQSIGQDEAATTTPGVKQEQVVYTKETFYSSFDPNQADVPRFELTETEKFILSLCLSLIRRERNSILMNQMDASEIHQHFINPRLAHDFDGFVDQALDVYHYLNTDCDLQLLVRGASELCGGGASNLSPICPNDATGGRLRMAAATSTFSGGTTNGDSLAETADTTDTYDLLKDYLIISPSAYNISLNSLNCSAGSGVSLAKEAVAALALGSPTSPRTNGHLVCEHDEITTTTTSTTTTTTNNSSSSSSNSSKARRRDNGRRYSVSHRSWDQFLRSGAPVQ